MTLYNTYLKSSIGILKIETNETKLLSIQFSKDIKQSSEYIPEILIKTKKQLNEYFEGKRKIFDLDTELSGTDFQLRTWELISQIPYGDTSTYSDLAIRLGSVKYTRAVGIANARNHLPIIIPCHRVIGKDGKLTGYAGGLEIKKWLLLHEQSNEPLQNIFLTHPI